MKTLHRCPLQSLPHRNTLACALALLSAVTLAHAQNPLPDSFDPGANGDVYALAVQTDGRILVGGNFTALAGQPRGGIGLLHPDGTLDPGFNLDTDGYITALMVQPDGKILLGGWFTMVGGQPHTNLARLNADRTLDGDFNLGTDGTVRSMAMQADGKVVLGGVFGTLGGQPRSGIARLNRDGTLDDGFNPGANLSVNTLAVQADGKILVGGSFTALAGQAVRYLARLNTNGTLDGDFKAPTPTGGNAVYSLAMQTDGKILVGNLFSTLGGQPIKYLARLNTDGTLDSGFNPAPDYSVLSLVLQADGKISAAGWFSSVGGQPRNRLARLNADGTLDAGFDAGVVFDSGVEGNYAFVDGLALQDDGKLLLGGIFTNLAGQPRMSLARLSTSTPATQSLGYSGSTITWLRGGSLPEIWLTTFEFSTNGTIWDTLGAATRIQGGWQLTGVALPPRGTLRAQGRVCGGYRNASGWYVERTLALPQPPPPPTILVNDGSFGVRTNQFGFTITGASNLVVVVEASTDLASSAWAPVGTNTLTGGSSYFSDPQWTHYPSRLYRLRSP